VGELPCLTGRERVVPERKNVGVRDRVPSPPLPHGPKDGIPAREEFSAEAIRSRSCLQQLPLQMLDFAVQGPKSWRSRDASGQEHSKNVARAAKKSTCCRRRAGPLPRVNTPPQARRCAMPCVRGRGSAHAERVADLR